MNRGDKLIYERRLPFTRMLVEYKMPTMCKSLGTRQGTRQIWFLDMK